MFILRSKSTHGTCSTTTNKQTKKLNCFRSNQCKQRACEQFQVRSTTYSRVAMQPRVKQRRGRLLRQEQHTREPVASLSNTNINQSDTYANVNKSTSSIDIGAAAPWCDDIVRCVASPRCLSLDGRFETPSAAPITENADVRPN